MLRLALVLVAVIAAGTALHSTSAAFTDAQTTHFTISSGSVAIERTDGGFVFDSAPLAPGDSAHATATIANTGTLPLKLTLSRETLASTAPGGCPIRSALHLKITGLFDGPLADAPAHISVGSLAPGDSRSYGVTLTFAAQHGATEADNDNCFQGSVDREQFSWDAVEARA